MHTRYFKVLIHHTSRAKLGWSYCLCNSVSERMCVPAYSACHQGFASISKAEPN